jgi:histidinol-phosphate aminotransferase
MIRGDIRAMDAYAVPDSRGMIKLDAMENPCPLPEKLRGDWANLLAQTGINRYPNAAMTELRAAIAAQDGLTADHVLLGNGSDELIQMLLMAADAGAAVIPSPTFVMYELIARWLKRPVISVQLDRRFDLDAEAFLRACDQERTAIAFLACPNNPTGNLWPVETVERICRSFKGLVVVDEAYHAFSGRTHARLIAPNVLILRTYSKLGWAGLRLGCLLGDPATIAEIDKVRLPYNINSLTQTSAAFFLKHFDIFEAQATGIRSERTRLSQAMAAIGGIEAFPSAANFLLFRVSDAPAVFSALRERGILIKNLHHAGGLLSGCLRVTIGKPEENDAFLTAIKEILA